MKSSEEF